jgi:hypothetical protein
MSINKVRSLAIVAGIKDTAYSKNQIIDPFANKDFITIIGEVKLEQRIEYVRIKKNNNPANHRTTWICDL